MSDVYDILRQIRSSKASPDANLTQDAIVKSYCSRLKASNLVDCRDIVKIIGEALEDAERRDGVSAFLRDFLGSCAILVGASDPKVSAEVELLRLLLKASSVKATLLRPETSLDSSLVGAHKFSLVSDTIDMEAVDCNDPSLALVSSTEEYCTRWAEGYLRLMVNSRDELAIARILCGPFGVLDEAAFKIIRREAGKTKMPIYQVQVFVKMRINILGHCIVSNAIQHCRRWCPTLTNSSWAEKVTLRDQSTPSTRSTRGSASSWTLPTNCRQVYFELHLGISS